MNNSGTKTKNGKRNHAEGICKAFAIVFLSLIFLSFVSPIALGVGTSPGTESEDIVIEFFWMQGCPACSQMKPFLEELKKDYDFEMNFYEISKNADYFLQRLEESNVPSNKRGYVPTTFIDGTYFIGYSEPIRSSIISILEGHEIDDESVAIGETVKTKVLGLWDVEVSLDEKSLLGAGFVLALLDSINVCSITVLIFLIIFSLSIGSLKKAFKIGVVFTIVIFIFYALFMLLLTGVLGFFVIQYGVYIRLAVITISVIAGLLLIKDFFWYGKGPSLSIPKFAKPLLEKYMKQATIGSTIMLGLLASLVELPCTAVFPLIYTTILAESGVAGIQKLIYILFYNLIYVWPLVFIVFATYFSWSKIENIDEKVQKAKGYMRLVAGIALLLIALYFAWPFIV